MRAGLKFKLPDGHNEAQIMNKLAAQYEVKNEPAIVEKFTLYDTFDWRLFNKSLVLSVSGKKLCLRKLAKNEIMHSVDTSTLPIFLWDFPDCELKEYLAPIIKMRALLKLVDVHSRSKPYRVLNRDEKTVARIVYQETRSSQNQNAPLLMAYL